MCTTAIMTHDEIFSKSEKIILGDSNNCRYYAANMHGGPESPYGNITQHSTPIHYQEMTMIVPVNLNLNDIVNLVRSCEGRRHGVVCEATAAIPVPTPSRLRRTSTRQPELLLLLKAQSCKKFTKNISKQVTPELTRSSLLLKHMSVRLKTFCRFSLSWRF